MNQDTDLQLSGYVSLFTKFVVLFVNLFFSFLSINVDRLEDYFIRAVPGCAAILSTCYAFSEANCMSFINFNRCAS